MTIGSDLRRKVIEILLSCLTNGEWFTIKTSTGFLNAERGQSGIKFQNDACWAMEEVRNKKKERKGKSKPRSLLSKINEV